MAKPAFLGRSGGGFMAKSGATAHPNNVAGFAGIYLVCDFVSYLGLEKAAGDSGLSADELGLRQNEFNAVARLYGLVKAHVPLFAINEDVVKVVPLEAIMRK